VKTAATSGLVERLHAELSGRGLSGPAPDRTDSIELQSPSADASRLDGLLRNLGFKEVRSPEMGRRAGSREYCGYDEAADRIIHLRTTAYRGSSGGTPDTRRGRRRASRSKSKTLVPGGTVIALVGADGAGKSSAAEALHRWLSPHFRVERIHMGKPRWSLTTMVLKSLIRLTKLRPPGRRARRSKSVDSAPRRAGFGLLLWHTVTARDRLRAHRRARRLAARGAVVICDRYPLAEIRSMDGRRTADLDPERRGWPASRLIALEENYYAAIDRPDQLIVLSVPADVAVQRRPEDPQARVRTRAGEILAIDWSAAGVHCLDSGRSLSAVHAELKRCVWDRL
jgi:thymidylate kinase